MSDIFRSFVCWHARRLVGWLLVGWLLLLVGTGAIWFASTHKRLVRWICGDSRHRSVSPSLHGCHHGKLLSLLSVLNLTVTDGKFDLCSQLSNKPLNIETGMAYNIIVGTQTETNHIPPPSLSFSCRLEPCVAAHGALLQVVVWLVFVWLFFCVQKLLQNR